VTNTSKSVTYATIREKQAANQLQAQSDQVSMILQTSDKDFRENDREFSQGGVFFNFCFNSPTGRERPTGPALPAGFIYMRSSVGRDVISQRARKSGN
jgi:hypothetical protein